MPRDLTSMSDLQRPLEQLFAALGRPFGSSAESALAAYHVALRDLPAHDVRRAIEYAIRDESKRPSPGAIRARAVALHRADQRGHSSPAQPSDRCPDCRQAYHYAAWECPEGSLTPGAVVLRLRCDCAHWDAISANWRTAAALAWTERDPQARAAIDRGELGAPPALRRRSAA